MGVSNVRGCFDARTIDNQPVVQNYIKNNYKNKKPEKILNTI